MKTIRHANTDKNILIFPRPITPLPAFCSRPVYTLPIPCQYPATFCPCPACVLFMPLSTSFPRPVRTFARIQSAFCPCYCPLLLHVLSVPLPVSSPRPIHATAHFLHSSCPYLCPYPVRFLPGAAMTAKAHEHLANAFPKKIKA